MAVIYVVIVGVVVVVGGFAAWRKVHPPEFDYVPNETTFEDPPMGAISMKGRLPWESVASPNEETAEIEAKESTYDASEDLLDPRNPHHAEWAKSHPEMQTDEEWKADHPEEPPPT